MPSAILLILKPGSSYLCEVKYSQKIAEFLAGELSRSSGDQLKGKVNHNQNLH